ncbi:MAG: hypothetical protein PHQ40_10770 [Anaerolineaceae bacterium]|nr:hypothetical protein [Anaerolineaceae bacterium]
MKKTYTFSEARQKLATLLNEAEQQGEVRVVRRNGTAFIIRPETKKQSPFDVPGVQVDLSTEEIVASIREGREREYPRRG